MCKYPYPDKLSAELRTAYEEEVDEIFTKQLNKSKKIVKRNKDLIDKILPELKKKKVLTADEFKQFLPADFAKT